MTPQQVEPLVVLASAWVQQQRAEHRPLGAPLPEVVRSFLSDYYDTSDLDTVRWRVVPEIANPPFREEIAAQLAAEGLPAIDFGNMAGITFIDTVVLSQSRRPPDSGTPSLLLHEMAHVVQYRLLGFDRFMHDYVRGLADNAFDYFSIPLERQAYSIEKRAATGERFLVEPVLTEMLNLG